MLSALARRFRTTVAGWLIPAGLLLFAPPMPGAAATAATLSVGMHSAPSVDAAGRRDGTTGAGRHCGDHASLPSCICNACTGVVSIMPSRLALAMPAFNASIVYRDSFRLLAVGIDSPPALPPPRSIG